jgi:hypothetical protein
MSEPMKFITLRVRPNKTIHGYDKENQPVAEEHPGSGFVEKVIAVDRILSFTEDNLYITVPHGRVQTWSYEGSLESVKSQLAEAGLLRK